MGGKTVATMFFEPSTRTKMFFDKAAEALSASTAGVAEVIGVRGVQMVVGS